MNEDKLKFICRTAWKNIFSYNFPAESSAEIEFINADGNILFNKLFFS